MICGCGYAGKGYGAEWIRGLARVVYRGLGGARRVKEIADALKVNTALTEIE